MSEDKPCPVTHRRDPDRIRHRAPGSQLCGGCIDDVYRQLQTLARFDVDATTAVIEQTLARSAGSPVSGSREPALVINRVITQHKIDAAGKLVAWLDEVIEKQQLARRTVDVAPGNLRRFASGLVAHVDWLVAQDAAVDFAEEVFMLGRKAWALLHPESGRKFTHRNMRCIETVVGEDGQPARCTGSMWALILPPDPYMPDFGGELVCDGCGILIPASGWLSYGRRVRAA